MTDTEKLLEFDKIKEIWRGLALTDRTKTKIDEVKPSLEEAEVRAQLRNTTEARMMLEKEGTPPLSALEDIREILAVAERGDCLTAAQLEHAENVLTVVKRMKD